MNIWGGAESYIFFLIKKGISTELNCCTFQFELGIPRTIQAVINYIYIFDGITYHYVLQITIK